MSLVVLALTLPVLALASLAILLTSGRPVLFVQDRIGLGGRPFRLFKLRTMANDAEDRKNELERSVPSARDGVRFKLRHDPRTTTVGRWLRRLSIDEFPQLWNVLRGDMSLVGPRPAVWREVRLYDPRELRRLEVKPGLTCLWQVSGRSELSFAKQVELDLEYIDRRTLRRDLVILARTIPAVLSGRGAF